MTHDKLQNLKFKFDATKKLYLIIGKIKILNLFQFTDKSPQWICYRRDENF